MAGHRLQSVSHAPDQHGRIAANKCFILRSNFEQPKSTAGGTAAPISCIHNCSHVFVFNTLQSWHPSRCSARPPFSLGSPPTAAAAGSAPAAVTSMDQTRLHIPSALGASKLQSWNVCHCSRGRRSAIGRAPPTDTTGPSHIPCAPQS